MRARRTPVKFAEQTAFQEQRLAVMERDGWSCRFEIAILGLPANETHHQGARITQWSGNAAWARCGSSIGLQTAHLIRRWKCGEILTDDGIPLKWHPLVAIAGCRDCHRRYDLRTFRDRVRAPADAAEPAARLITHTLAAARARGEVAIDVDLSGLGVP